MERGYHDPEGKLTAEDRKHLDQMWAAFDGLREHLEKEFPDLESEIDQHVGAIEMNIKWVAFQLCTRPAPQIK